MERIEIEPTEASFDGMEDAIREGVKDIDSTLRDIRKNSFELLDLLDKLSSRENRVFEVFKIILEKSYQPSSKSSEKDIEKMIKQAIKIVNKCDEYCITTKKHRLHNIEQIIENPEKDEN